MIQNKTTHLQPRAVDQITQHHRDVLAELQRDQLVVHHQHVVANRVFVFDVEHDALGGV